jgi:hypothetical protein
MAGQWFYIENGNETGPLSSGEMRRLADAKLIRESTLVRSGLDGKWIPAAAVVGLLKDVQTPQHLNPLPPSRSPTPPPLPRDEFPAVPPAIPAPPTQPRPDPDGVSERSPLHPITWIAIGCVAMVALVLITTVMNRDFVAPSGAERMNGRDVSKAEAPKADRPVPSRPNA